MISVIIPTYNRERTIKRAILSVLNQTYKDVEVIVVDDNSNDNTENIVVSLSDKRLKYYKMNNNMGACYARNYGIKKANGEYIAFQDSDDEWLPKKLEKQLSILKEHNADITFCSLNLYEEGKLLKKMPQHIRSGYIDYDKLIKKSIISTQTILFKKECFEKELFNPEMPRFQDWELMLRLSQKYKIYYEDEVLVNLHSQKDSISKNDIKAIKALEKIMDINKEKLSEDNRALSNIYIYYASFLKEEKNKRSEYLKKGLSIKFDIISIAKTIKCVIKNK